jgi:hypothetical protein
MPSKNPVNHAVERPSPDAFVYMPRSGVTAVLQEAVGGETATVFSIEGYLYAR